MAQIVVMPQLGNTVESCLITKWLVAVGDTVDAGTTLCEIETDKSTMDVPAGTAGVVLALLAADGDDVPVKEPIAVVGAAGESAEEALAAAGVAPQVTGEGGEVDESRPDDQAPQVAAVATTSARHAVATGAASPRARALAASKGVGLDAITDASGPQGRIIERDVQAAIAAGPGLTRGAFGAADHVLGQTGTGIGGRVTTSDLASPTEAASTPAPRTIPTVEFPGAFTDTPLKGVRKLVSDRMLASLLNSAQLTFNSSARASALLALRARLKASDPSLGLQQVTIGDLVAFAAVQTAKRYASTNAHLSDNVLRTFETVHLGLAVDTPRGLLVPTVRDASSMGLRGFSAASKEVITASQAGNISPDLLSGATFTVTNLGAMGIESFTPILNLPQTAILGVDAVVPRPVVNPDGSFGVEQRIGFSLTVDHRVVDGADAARFLADLARFIENIDLVVVG